MDNPFDETRRAVELAEMQLRAVDQIATNMAKLLVNRLRHVNSVDALSRLKRELTDWNIHTGKWKEKDHG